MVEVDVLVGVDDVVASGAVVDVVDDVVEDGVEVDVDRLVIVAGTVEVDDALARSSVSQPAVMINTPARAATAEWLTPPSCRASAAIRDLGLGFDRTCVR